MCGCEDFLFGFGVEPVSNRVDVIRIVWLGIVEAQNTISRAFKIACHYVQVVDLGTSEDECQTHVPVSLLSRAKDRHVVHRISLLEEHC